MSWDMIKRLSPAIPTLLAVVDHFERTVNRYQRYRSHSSPEYEKDVQTLCAYYRCEGAYADRTPARKGLDRAATRKMLDNKKTRDNAREGARLLQTGKTMPRWTENRKRPRSTEQNFDAMFEVRT
jgi:hypothetical protein